MQTGVLHEFRMSVRGDVKALWLLRGIITAPFLLTVRLAGRVADFGYLEKLPELSQLEYRGGS